MRGVTRTNRFSKQKSLHEKRLKSSITVVIPTLGNRKEFLHQALNAIEAQSLRPMELIIVNNGKTSLSKKDFTKVTNFPITVINTIDRAGASQARNIGATFAKGEFIAFLDDDDLWEANYLEEMLKKALHSDAKCVITRISKVQDGRSVGLVDATEYLSQRYFVLMNPGVTGSNILIEKDLFLSLGGYDCTLPTGEDGDLILKVLDSGASVMVCDSTKAVMRVHDGERLTGSASLAKGYKALYVKYKSRVGIRDVTYLIWRYKREEYNSRKQFQKFCSMLFWSGIVILIRRTPKSIHAIPKKSNLEKK